MNNLTISVRKKITIFVDKKLYGTVFFVSEGYADYVNKATALAYEAGQRSNSTNYYWSSKQK